MYSASMSNDSEVLDGQLQSCYTARARPKYLTEEKCFKTTLEQS